MKNIIDLFINKDWSNINELILKDKIDWNVPIDQTNGAIHYLAYHGQIKLIKHIDKTIIKEIADQANTEKDNICHIAAKLGNINLLKYIINLTIEPIYQRNIIGCTPLYYVITNYDLIKWIVQKYHTIDHQISNEYTLLDFYVYDHRLDIFEYLLNHIELNNISNYCLFSVIESNNTSEDKKNYVALLLEHGIDINALNMQFLSALILSLYLEEFDLATYLIQHGADVTYAGPENNHNPLIISILLGNADIIELLILNCDVNIRDKYFRTPIHYVFDDLNSMLPIKIKKKLLKMITNINMVDNNMDSILGLLIKNDNWKLYEHILEERKLKIYLKNKDDMRPIDYIKPDDLDDFYYMVYKSYINQLASDVKWLDKIDQKAAILLDNGEDIGSIKPYIMRKIIGGQSWPQFNVHGKVIKMIRPPETNITHFSAYTYNYICFLYSILKKYPDIKIPSLAPNQTKGKTLKELFAELTEDHNDRNNVDDSVFRSIIRDYINHSPILTNHIIIWRSPNKYYFSDYIIQGIHETLQKYPHTKFVLLKLTIVNDANFNHANILIYDVPNKVIERFDPYGKVPYIDNEMIDGLLRAFVTDYFPDVTYVSPNEILDGISFQVYSDETNGNNYTENDPVGFCMAWCLWYVETRIKNPEIRPDILVKRTLNEINKSVDSFKDYIRNYSNYLDHEKNVILRDALVPEKYWYKHHLPSDIYAGYLKHIRKIYHDII